MKGLARRREVQEQRFRGVVPGDDGNCLARHQRSGVPLLLDRLVVAPPVGAPAAIGFLQIVDLAGKMPVEMLVAALGRPCALLVMAQMPLADQDSAVARVAQRLRKGALVVGQRVGVEPLDLHRLQPVAHGIAAGEHRRACLCRVGLHIELFKPGTAAGEAVQRGRANAAAVVAHIFPAQVVGGHVQDVRRLRVERWRRENHA